MSTPTISEKLKTLALDLTKDYPRSPRETLAGYVIAARSLDKCRALLNGTNGEYNYDCPLDRYFFDFTGIDSNAFKALAATGASDDEVAAWITEHAKQTERIEIVKWNNNLRYRTPRDLDEESQLFVEDCLLPLMPKGKVARFSFDFLDIEEGRI